jgi:hypothetical protein
LRHDRSSILLLLTNPAGFGSTMPNWRDFCEAMTRKTLVRRSVSEAGAVVRRFVIKLRINNDFLNYRLTLCHQ